MPPLRRPRTRAHPVQLSPPRSLTPPPVSSLPPVTPLRNAPLSIEEKKESVYTTPKRLYSRLTDEDYSTICTLAMQGQGIKSIVAHFLPRVIKRTTVYSVLGKWRTEHRITKKAKGGSPKKYTQAVIDTVLIAQESHAAWTLKQVRDYVKREHNITPSTSWIAKCLKENGFTTKTIHEVPINRNTPENIAARKSYAREASGWEDDELIFIDESGFNLHLHRSRGRARLGDRATICTPSARGGNVTLIAAISPLRGLVKYQIVTGSVNQTVYAQFLTNLLAEPAFQVRSHVIVQDNVAFHRTETVKEVFTGARIQHRQVFLPPYSPQLNPIENCFSKWKAYVRRQDLSRSNKDSLITLMHDAAQSITAQDCAGWYRQVMRQYTNCIDGKPLEE